MTLSGLNLDINDFRLDYSHWTICEMYGCDFYEAEEPGLYVCRDCHAELKEEPLLTFPSNPDATTH